MSAKVVLHVYDLTRGMARQMSASLLGKQIDGVWHTGVFVFGKEYFYGGGIQAIHPSFLVGTYGNPIQTIELGATEVPLEAFEAFLQEISPRFTAATYNLLSHNCNNFSNEVAHFLLGSGIPQHILDLPNQVLSTPMGAMFRPMIEEMQASMARSIEGNSVHFDPVPSRAAAAPLTSASPVPSAASRTLSSYVKRIVSYDPAAHFPLILRRAHQTKPFSVLEQAAFDRLSVYTTTNDVSHIQGNSDRAAWWSYIAVLLKDTSSNATFNALCLLRVVLVAESALNEQTPLTETHEVLSIVVERCESNHNVPPAHRILLLSVLVNSLAVPSTAGVLHDQVARFLPFVWSTWHTPSTPATHGPVAAAVVYNLCHGIRPEKADDGAQFTLVGGCAEVLDLYANSPPNHEALERLVVALGLLLQQCTTSKLLAAEIGLIPVLSRLKTLTTPHRELIGEVLALI